MRLGEILDVESKVSRIGETYFPVCPINTIPGCARFRDSGSERFIFTAHSEMMTFYAGFRPARVT